MPRFYIPSTSFTSGQQINLPTEAVHHAMRVLRMKEGDEVELFNGEGSSASGTIHFEKNKAEVHLNTIQSSQEEILKIILLQALVANDKMDWIVEKACELGVSQLNVFPPRRTDIKIEGDKINKRLERWKRIVISACSQCGRNKLLEIGFCPSWQEALGRAQGLKLLLHPATNRKEAFPQKLDTVSFLIGPEGGFTQKEIASALDMGFEAIRLGNLVMRTETAGIAATVFAQTLWGTFKPY